MKGKNILVVFFQFISSTINGGEKAIIDLISAIVPYLVPIIPAWLMYYHAEHDMGFSHNIAITAGSVVEGLGLASVATAVRFFLYNRRFKKDAKTKNPNKAPFWAAMGVYAFYVVVVMLVNVIMEANNTSDSGRSGWTITAIALFSLLSFPSGLLVALRVGFAEMLEERASGRRGSGAGSPAAGGSDEDTSVKGKKVKEKHASDFQPKILAYLDKVWRDENRVAPPSEISAHLKLDNEKAKGYISTETGKWRKANNVPRDPNKPFGY
jgi:uncharacterized membrane protein YhaH (DUF805 family)